VQALITPLAWLARLFQRPSAVTDAVAAQPRPFLVLVPPLPGDAEGETADRLVQALSGRKSLLTRRIAPPNIPEIPHTAAGLAAALGWARQVLLDEAGDVMLWGGVAGRILRLHLTARPSNDARLPGPALELPAAVEGPLAEIVHAAVLGALEPAGDAQRHILNDLLPPAAAAVEPIVKKPPGGLSPRQQGLMLAVQARAAAAMAAVEPQKDWWEQAEAALDAALKRIPPRDRQPLDDPMLLRQLAAVLLAKAEQSGAEQDHERAIAACRTALEVFPRDAFPVEWAAEQARLGVALYRFDLRTGRTDLLKEAIGCLQSALQVFGRHEDPRRWAELTMDLVQALQVYGDAVKSVEILDRAVSGCRAVLELRPREGDPLGWAAAMHALGTALFLRDKHDDASTHLDEAALILRQAADTYRSLGLTRLAGLSEKNIGHVERLAKVRQERGARFDWAQLPDED
jgi:tetratricopeptide (TPR) repeat protein